MGLRAARAGPTHCTRALRPPARRARPQPPAQLPLLPLPPPLPQPFLPQRGARRRRLGAVLRRVRARGRGRALCPGTAPPLRPAGPLCGTGWAGTACPRAAARSFGSAAPAPPCPGGRRSGGRAAGEVLVWQGEPACAQGGCTKLRRQAPSISSGCVHRKAARAHTALHSATVGSQSRLSGGQRRPWSRTWMRP